MTREAAESGNEKELAPLMLLLTAHTQGKSLPFTNVGLSQCAFIPEGKANNTITILTVIWPQKKS